MERYLFGREVTPDTNISANYFATVVCPAVTKAMIVRRILTYPLVNGDYKSSLYKATAGDPADQITGSKVWNNNTAVSVVAGSWRELATDLALNFAIGDIPVLAACASATGAIARNSGAASGYTRKYKAATYSTYTAPAVPIDTLTAVASAGQAMVAYGYVDPTVTSVAGDNILAESDIGDEIAIVGTDFVGDNATGEHKVELCDNAVYGSAVVKIPLQITGESGGSHISDTEIICRYQRNGLLGAGTAYIFVTTDLGLRNAVGFPVTLGSAALYATQNQRHIVSGNIGIEGSVLGSANGTVELCETPSHAGSSIKVPQTVVEWSDKRAVFTVNLTGLSEYPTVYCFVTTAQGGRNTLALGFKQDSAVVPASTDQTHAMRYRKRERRV